MLGAELVQVIGFNGVLYKAKKEPKIILPKINRHITEFYYSGNFIPVGLGRLIYAQCYHRRKRIVVKVGSSTLCYANGHLNLERIED